MYKSRFSFFAALIACLPTHCLAAVISIDKANPSCSDSTGTPYCSISAGISAAVNGDTLEVHAGTYNENLAILKSITINGAGAETTIIDGGGIDTTVFIHGMVILSGVTIQNGDAGDTGLGGGIWVNNGGLMLTDAVVKNNHASDGGGIGTAASLTLTRTIVSGNTASNSNNTASGGGIYITNDGVNITDSTISDNTSDYSAGGIFNMGYGTTITNSTLSGNLTTGYGGGGALVNGSASPAGIRLGNVTITGNKATVLAGGILNNNGGVRLHNTIVSGNNDAGHSPDCGGIPIDSDGYNFIGSTSGCTLSQATGDLLNLGAAAAMLGTLAYNGGSTPTHPILSGSAVIDAGDPTGCTDAADKMLASDQTGRSRAIDGDADGMPTCDIGAYEFSHGLVIDSGNSPLITTEGMGMAAFEVVLTSQPTSSVTVPLSSSDTSEGTVSPETLIFTPTDWNVRQQVVITGVDDNEADGDVDYRISIGATRSLDPKYDSLGASDLNITNRDDEGTAPTNPGAGNGTSGGSNTSGGSDNSSDSGGGGSLDVLLLLALLAEVVRRANACGPRRVASSHH